MVPTGDITIWSRQGGARPVGFLDALGPQGGADSPLDPLTLIFRDAALEGRFRVARYRTFLPFLRIALVLALLLYAGFGIADIYVVPDFVVEAWIVRYAVVCPLILAVIALSFTAAFERFHQWALSAVILFGGLGVDYMAVTAAPPGNYTYYVGALIIVFYSFHFLRIDFLKALLLAWISFAAYEVGALAFDTTPLAVAVANTFFFVTTNLVAMMTGYLQEYLIRRDFLQQVHLDQGRRQLDSMAANVPGAVFRLVRGTDGRVSLPYIADGLREYFDRDPDALRAQPAVWVDWIHPDDRKVWREAFRQAQVDRMPFEAVVRLNGERGGVRWMRTVGRAHELDDGSVAWDGICLDITDLKDREDELRQAVKMEAMGRLTGGVAHDFNNSLLAIIGNLELVKDVVADNPAALRCVVSALRAADYSTELTRRLLAYSRKQSLAPKATDINDLVRSVSQLLQPSVNDGIDMQLVLDDELWPAVVDAGQLESALVNLAVNAFDAMPNGGSLRLITKNAVIDEPLDAPGGVLAPGDYIIVTVADTGTGMPPEVAKQVFEPFFTTKDVGKGSGLGLSMVFGFADQSGGQVLLDTAPGKGTAFSIYLPRAMADATPREDRTAAASTDLPTGSELLLVVEDEVAVREFIASSLTALGYKVVDVEQAHSALSLIARGLKPDLLLTDIVLPGPMDGLELARHMRGLVPGIGVIMMSAHDRGILQGRDDPAPLLEKPFRREILAHAIRRELDEDVHRREPEPSRENQANSA
jgi:signal transduction histidine kinase/CheY-like chemotaxis protein